MDTTATIATALVATGLAVLGVLRLYPSKQIIDGFSDADTTTASLTDLINGGGDRAGKAAGGGGGVKARPVGSHTQTNRPSIAPSEQGSV